MFPAELPDKSALASLMLGSRYRPAYVFAGVAAAFAVHVVLALVAGGLLGLLPHRVLSAIVAALFGAGAVILVIRRSEEDTLTRRDRGAHRVVRGRGAGGRGLLRVVPIRLITLAGAAVMAVLAVISLISAIRG